MKSFIGQWFERNLGKYTNPLLQIMFTQKQDYLGPSGKGIRWMMYLICFRATLELLRHVFSKAHTLPMLIEKVLFPRGCVCWYDYTIFFVGLDTG